MVEFETFVYLDLQKTGSSFILRLLENFAAEKQLRAKRHAGLGADYDAAKFHFITVRDPLDAYLSLYSFGCQSEGKLRAAMDEGELDQFYDGTLAGFGAWLGFVLKPCNARLLGGGYARAADGALAGLVGLQSYRYLRLALPDAAAVLARCRTRQDIRDAHAARKLPAFVIRHESFTADLCEVLRGRLSHALGDVDAALRFVETADPVNASRRIDAGRADFVLDDALSRKLRRREWLLHELFGY